MKTIDSPLTALDVVITEVHRHKEAMISEHNDDVDALLQHLASARRATPGSYRVSGAKVARETRILNALKAVWV